MLARNLSTCIFLTTVLGWAHLTISVKSRNQQSNKHTRCMEWLTRCTAPLSALYFFYTSCHYFSCVQTNPTEWTLLSAISRQLNQDDWEPSSTCNTMNKTFEERLSKSLPSSLHVCFLHLATLYDILPSSTAVWKRYKGIKVTISPWDVFGGLSLCSHEWIPIFPFWCRRKLTHMDLHVDDTTHSRANSMSLINSLC